MTDDKKESKLVPKLDLNFTDYAIDTFVPSFVTKDEVGTITRDEISTPLKVEGNRILNRLNKTK